MERNGFNPNRLFDIWDENIDKIREQYPSTALIEPSKCQGLFDEELYKFFNAIQSVNEYKHDVRQTPLCLDQYIIVDDDFSYTFVIVGIPYVPYIYSAKDLSFSEYECSWFFINNKTDRKISFRWPIQDYLSHFSGEEYWKQVYFIGQSMLRDVEALKYVK